MIGFPSDGGLVTAGVTGTTALGLSAVWRCLDILSNGVSQLDWAERRGNLDLPPSRLIRRPQAEITRREWVSVVVSTLALYDVTYLLKAGGEDAEGVPQSLLYLDPRIVQPKLTDMFSILPPTEFYVGQYTVPRERLVILHRSPQPGISDQQAGLINLARIKFAEAIAADGYSSRYWQAGGPTDRALVSAGNMPDTVAKENSERWAERRMKGPDYVPTLTGGMDFKQYGVDPTAQSAVEARRELVADIGRYFGVPTRILNAPTGDTETYATSESGNQDLVRYTLQNYIGAIEDAISDQLPGGRRLVMDTRRLTAGTQLAQAQALQLLTGNKAVMTPEEAREWIGLPPMENPEELNPPAPAPVVVASGGQTNGGQG
jgi:HK97 family phage portal protein